MKVVCIKNLITSSSDISFINGLPLTSDKVYYSIWEFPDAYVVRCDDGEDRIISKLYFKKLEDIRESKLKKILE